MNKRCLCGSGKAFKNCHGQEFLLPKTLLRAARYAEAAELVLEPNREARLPKVK